MEKDSEKALYATHVERYRLMLHNILVWLLQIYIDKYVSGNYLFKLLLPFYFVEKFLF